MKLTDLYIGTRIFKNGVNQDSNLFNNVSWASQSFMILSTHKEKVYKLNLTKSATDSVLRYPHCASFFAVSEQNKPWYGL